MFLSDMKENQIGVISTIDFDDAFTQRLEDIGFCKGENVKCIKIASLSSPILYRVKGSDIALRKSDAGRIGVIL